MNIKWGEKSLLVDFDYTPAERDTYDSPGCDEEYEISEVLLLPERADIFFLFNDSEVLTCRLLELLEVAHKKEIFESGGDYVDE